MAQQAVQADVHASAVAPARPRLNLGVGRKSIMDIDDFIIADTSSRWRKVAMVIGSALLNPEIQIPEGKDKAQLVATRIETMVRDGKLEVEGSLKDWRYSEVRHAQSS